MPQFAVNARPRSPATQNASLVISDPEVCVIPVLNVVAAALKSILRPSNDQFAANFGVLAQKVTARAILLVYAH